MLKNLFVKNYVLIESLELDFSTGFSVLTGETGSGKSILLGALGLVLGERANRSAIGINSDKCVIEATFEVDFKKMNNFFVQNNLELSKEVVIRRILFSNGKSKAFINEEPVSLEILKILGNQLVDIHSQHQNLYLRKQEFQLNVIDVFAQNELLLNTYKKDFELYKNLLIELKNLNQKSEQEKANLEFYTYQLEKFEQVDLENKETQNLEKELEVLNHAEEIQQKLYSVKEILKGGDFSVLSGLDLVLNDVQFLVKYFESAKELSNRFESCLEELTDCFGEIQNLDSQIEFDAQRLLEVQNQMAVLYQLYEVFRVSSLEELMNKKIELEQNINSIKCFEKRQKELEIKIKKQKKILENQARILSERRQETFSKLEKSVVVILQDLGMEQAVFEVSYSKKEKLNSFGKDEISFLFSANKNRDPKEISKVASGGEISRIMLTFKFLIARSNFSTIIFDEIDTGVSGHVAEKMAYLMQEMGIQGQVFTITHLPQIASKADTHFQVKKIQDDFQTKTLIKNLSIEERIDEIAQMLSGEVVSKNAKRQAKELLKG